MDSAKTGQSQRAAELSAQLQAEGGRRRVHARHIDIEARAEPSAQRQHVIQMTARIPRRRVRRKRHRSERTAAGLRRGAVGRAAGGHRAAGTSEAVVRIDGTVDADTLRKVESAMDDDPFLGHVFMFRGRRSNVVKPPWPTCDGLCLLAKRLECGRFVWAQATSGSVTLTQAQLSTLIEQITWHQPVRTWRPQLAI